MLECKGLNEYLKEYNRFSAQGAYLLLYLKGGQWFETGALY